MIVWTRMCLRLSSRLIALWTARSVLSADCGAPSAGIEIGRAIVFEPASPQAEPI